MIADHYMPLRKAAKLLNVNSKTMRRWLEQDCGLSFQAMGRGRQPLISEQDVQTVISKRTGVRNWSRASRRIAPQQVA